MKEHFRNLLKKSPLTLQEIASRAGYTVDYVYRLKRDTAKERFNEDTIKSFASALDLYPSELLPPSWQKPSAAEIDIEILAKAIETMMSIKAANAEIEVPQKLLLTSGDYKTIGTMYKQFLGKNRSLKGEIAM